MRTIKELAQEAIDVQNACNLSGVVHSFSRAITDLRAILEQEPNFNTEMLNTHPVCVLFADKISSLVNENFGVASPFSQAYEWAQNQIK